MGNTSSNSEQHQEEISKIEQSESSETTSTSKEITTSSSTKIEDENQNLNFQQSKKFDLKNFRNECLRGHNEKRKLHRVIDLNRNSDLDDIAQEYAEKLAQADSLNHSSNKFNGQRIGENLYMQGGRAMLGNLPVDSWYGESNNYDFNNPTNSSGVTGHFTQLVWKGSKELGVGCAKARNGSFYCVCNYFPAGNWVGEERENVYPR